MIRLVAAEAAPRGGARAVVGPIDLTIEPGERHLVVGANGSGKTTLMRLLAGLAPAAAGSIRWDGLPDARGAASPGRAAASEGPPALWPRVAALFETPDPQFLADTVRSDIAFGLEGLGISAAEMRDRIDEAVHAYGLRLLADRDPRTLSAGEKARALLAAAHAARPACLLLDQTLAHLDPGARRAFEARLAGAERAGAFAVVRTHQECEPPFAGERFHVLDEGRLHDIGALTPADVHAGRRLPLPLATRVAAVLEARGAWNGTTAADISALRAGLECGGGATTVHLPRALARTDPPRAASAERAPRSERAAFALDAVRWGPGRGTPLFENFDLAGERGGIVALVGRSGSGKTSLLRLLAGIDAPHAGTAWRPPTPKGVRRATALALEYPERQLIGRTVLEDVAMALWVDGIPEGERDRRARIALAAVGVDVERFAGRAPFTLSEGEKRRVALAGLLAEPAPLLLFDEPTAGLDPEGRRALRDTFAALRAGERTIIVASHDLDFVHAVADRVVLLARGEEGPAQVIREGAPGDVFRDAPAMSEAAMPPPDVVLVEDLLRAWEWLPATPVRGGDALIELLERGAASRSAPTTTDVGAA